MKSTLLFVSILSIGTGCVSQTRYDDALKSASDAHSSVTRLSSELVAKNRECDANETELANRARVTQASLDEQTAQSAELRAAIEASGKNADQLLADKGSLSEALQQSRARLEELRRAQVAAEARAALYRQLALKFDHMIGAGEVSISIRDGRMVLAMPNDVLFDSGHKEIKKTGQRVLESMAGVLKTLPRRFQVAGHTDNVPISTERFPSNWELSSARAIEVIHFLTDHGIPSTALSAAGYSEFDPVASNKDENGRKRNRRIEITLEPNIDELVAVPDVK